MTRTETAYDQYVPPATVNEMMWMVLDHATRRQDDALFHRAAALVRRHLTFAWDDVYGGLFTNCYHVDKNRWEIDRKGLWAQVETLNALEMIVERTDASWAHDWHARLSGYVLDKWPADQYGAPLWLDYTDRKVTFEPHSNRLDILHYPRHLMLSLLSMERRMGTIGALGELRTTAG